MSNLWLGIATQGLAANRPTTPDVPAGTVALYYATDTNVLSAFSNGAWTVINSNTKAIGVGAAKTAVAGLSGLYLLDTAAGSVLTLPAATGSGLELQVVCSVSATSNAHKILTSPITDVLIGRAVGSIAAGTPLQFSALVAGGFHSLQMPFAGTQPSGGLQGDCFYLKDIAAGVWEVTGQYESGTTSTTPFSTATT